MPDYQKQGMAEGGENGENGTVAVYNAPNKTAPGGTTQNSSGQLISCLLFAFSSAKSCVVNKKNQTENAEQKNF